MRLAITGASGYVGRSLVPLLHDAGIELCLLGRDREKLRALFPSFVTHSYAGMKNALTGCDTVLHLATINNNSELSGTEINATNVDFTISTAETAKILGVKKFIFASSVHALNHENQSAYAQSKRIAADRLRQLKGIEVGVIYLPFMLAGELPLSLGFLARWPTYIRSLALQIITALKPTGSVLGLVELLINLDTTDLPNEIFLRSQTEQNGIYKIFRKFVDIGFAFAILVLFCWLFILLYLLIRLDSSGPAFFAQRRMGRNGQLITLLKFRTMKVGTLDGATHTTSASQITKIGQFLRRSKLDELPQIFNLFSGSLSLVGPRPCLPSQFELINDRNAFNILRCNPGITGLAQVNGIDMSDPPRLAHWDASYLAQQSIITDLRVILATFIGRGSGDRVRK